MQTYLVGGAVRDQLLNLPVEERDWVVVGATPEDMIAQGFTPVGKDFPVFLHPDTKDEYALARTERKQGHGYTGFAVHASPDVTLEDDLLRRDLTINAIAQAEDGTLIDPYGGQGDLNDGLLRHVSPAFVEDPVRILRVARFAARFDRWGFRVAHSTNALMRKMVDDGEVDYLVPERVWAEFVKALKTDRPARFFKVLHGCGALAKLFPEIEALYTHDNGAHGEQPELAAVVFEAFDSITDRLTSPEQRFAALARILASAQGKDTAASAVAAISTRYKAPNDYRELALLVARHGEDFDTARELPAEAIMDLLENTDAFRRPERFDSALKVCAAVSRSDYPQADHLHRCRNAAAGVDTRALIQEGLKGPAIGARLRQERIDVIKQQA